MEDRQEEEKQPQEDEYMYYDEEAMIRGDDGPCLVMRKVLITPRNKDDKDWHRHNVF